MRNPTDIRPARQEPPVRASLPFRTAAELAGTTREHVASLVAAGHLPCETIRGVRYVDLDALDLLVSGEARS